MTSLKLFLGKYSLLLQVAVVAILLAAIGVQTLRLAESKTDYAELQATVAMERQARAEQYARDVARYRAAEQQLVAKAGEIQEKARANESALRARVADLRDQLRNRPSRPAEGAASAAAASPPVAHTGAGLYREDGEFLAGEAAAAAIIVGERDLCYAQYDAAREALKRLVEQK